MAVAIKNDRQQRAKDALDACHASEQEIAQFIKEKKSPFHRDYSFARSNLQHNYEKAIFADFGYALEKGVEINLWKRVFYAVIEKCRGDLREMEKRALAEKKSANGDKKNARQGEQRKLADQYRNFLINAVRFYLGFVQRLASEFALEEARDILTRHQLVYTAPATASDYSPKLRRSALNSCQRSIIFLGDLERYKELAAMNKSRDFSAAVSFYTDARELIPANGHPFNQLGVIAAYTPDDFGLGPMYFYYRASCVRTPFEIAPGNLEQLFTKAYDGYRKDVDSVKSSPFLVNYMRLHAFIFLKHGTSKSGLQTFDQLESVVLKQLKIAIAELQLSQVNVYRCAISSLACLQTLRQRKAGKNGPELPEHGQRRRVAEMRALFLIVRFFKVLIDLANDEVFANPMADEHSDRAVDGTSESGMISPILRRVLPSLRACSKWLRTHLTILHRVWSSHEEVGALYRSYANFQNGIQEAFMDAPALNYALEEDLDLMGFLPLKSLMLDRSKVPSKKMHPNEEQLMRLSDLQQDGSAISQHLHGGLLMNNSKYEVKPTPVKQARDVIPTDFFDMQEDIEMNGHGHVGFSLQDMVDDITGDKDQPMTDAHDEDDSDEEQIVIERKERPSVTPAAQSPLPQQLSSPAVLQQLQQPAYQAASSSPAPRSSMTATDLVAQILNPMARPSTTPAQPPQQWTSPAQPPQQWNTPSPQQVVSPHKTPQQMNTTQQSNNSQQSKTRQQSKTPQQWYAAAPPAPPSAPPPPPQWQNPPQHPPPPQWQDPSPPQWNAFSSPLMPPNMLPPPSLVPQPPPPGTDRGIFGPGGPFGDGRGQDSLPGIWSSSWTGSPPVRAPPGFPPGLGKTSSTYASYGNTTFSATSGPFGSSISAQWKPEKEHGEWEGYG